jgi:hypothetical protein
MTGQAKATKSPVGAAWACLFFSWFFALLPIPFVSIGGVIVLSFVVVILAVVCLANGATANGVVILLCAVVVTPIMYFLGLALVGMIGAGALQSMSSFR